MKCFFRNMADEPFDKVYDRNSFLNVLVIFMTVVMESDKIACIRIDSGSGNNRTIKVSTDIFGNSLRVTTVWLGINIEAVFMFKITSGKNFFKRRTNAE